MKNIIIGTAGHIDHGKTTLIKALTGRNTDRWLEEQRRGITIDLGFTYFDLPTGDRAGIIDVPGHEKFIHNMVAGVVGMDMVLLVIAADEGIMPQTREHMAILNLLGIEKCIVVLNKCDLVEEEWLELMEEEVKEEFSDTFLKDAPVIPVSSVSGQGLDELVKAIVEMAGKEVVPKEINTICRLPVDRAFIMSGFGTVVTGTLVSGTISKEDSLELFPSGKECKVRGIQVHGKEQDICYAGQRVAINLSNLKKNEIYRGCVLAPVNSMKNTSLLDAKIRMLDSTERILTNRMRLHLFTGTSEVLCRAVLLDKEEIGPGETGYVQLILEEDIAVRRGDRFVVRFYSPMETIGGGVILEPNPRFKRRFRQEVIEELKQKESGSSADVVFLHANAHADTLITVKELAKLTALTPEEIEKDVAVLEETGQLMVFPMKKDTYVWPTDQSLMLQQIILKAFRNYEADHPYRHGMKKAEIQMTYFKKVKSNVFSMIMEAWEKQGFIASVGEYLCTPGHEVQKDEVYEKISAAMLSAWSYAGFDFIRYAETNSGNAPQEIKDDILNLLREEGLVLRLSEEVYTTAELMQQAAEKIRQLLAEDPVISIGQVRDVFATSRKNVKLILEYTDSVKLTRNNGAESEWRAY